MRGLGSSDIIPEFSGEDHNEILPILSRQNSVVSLLSALLVLLLPSCPMAFIQGIIRNFLYMNCTSVKNQFPIIVELQIFE